VTQAQDTTPLKCLTASSWHRGLVSAERIQATAGRADKPATQHETSARPSRSPGGTRSRVGWPAGRRPTRIQEPCVRLEQLEMTGAGPLLSRNMANGRETCSALQACKRRNLLRAAHRPSGACSLAASGSVDAEVTATSVARLARHSTEGGGRTLHAAARRLIQELSRACALDARRSNLDRRMTTSDRPLSAEGERLRGRTRQDLRRRLHARPARCQPWIRRPMKNKGVGHIFFGVGSVAGPSCGVMSVEVV
jgi:hypothetical protein